MYIAISGPDGSGKTTIAKLTIEYLNKLGINCKYEKLEIEANSLFFLKPIVNLAKFFFPRVYKNKNKKFGEALDEKRKNKKSLFHSLICRLVLVDKISKIKLKNFFKRHTVYVTDEYVYDNLLSFYQSKMISKKTFERFINLIPKPQSLIITDCDEEIFYSRRKKDYGTLERAKNTRTLFKSLALRLNTRQISTEQSPDITFKECIAKIHFDLTPDKSDLLINVMAVERPHLHLLKFIDFNKISIAKIIKKVEKQRLYFPLLYNLYSHLSQNYPKRHNDIKLIETKINEFEKRVKSFEKSYEKIIPLFESNNIKYIFFKTLRNSANVTNDIDVVVDKYEKAKSLFLANGWKIDLDQIALEEIHLIRDDVILDLHNSVEYIDKKDLFRNVHKGKRKVLPEINYEIYLILSECFEDNVVDNEDLHFINSLLKANTVSWEKILLIAKKYHLKNKIKLLIGYLKEKTYIYYERKIFLKYPEMKTKAWSISDINKSSIHILHCNTLRKYFRIINLVTIAFLKRPVETFKKTIKKYFGRT